MSENRYFNADFEPLSVFTRLVYYNLFFFGTHK